jgi:hypothetical protein
MSNNHLKRPKLSIDLDHDTIKRAKRCNDNMEPDSSPDTALIGLNSTEAPLSFENLIFDENDNHAIVDMHEPTSPLTPLDELASFLEASSITPSTSRWCRNEENKWLLEGETQETLIGPEWTCMYSLL